MLRLSPERVAQEAILSFFGIKVNFNSIKSAIGLKFLCVKTSSGKVVAVHSPILRFIDINAKSKRST